MRQRKVKWIAKLLVFAMVLESGMLSSADIVSAKEEDGMQKAGGSQIISPEKITGPYIGKDKNRQPGQEKLAGTEAKEETEKEWELVVNPNTPMDKVLFYSDNNPEGKGYYYGYKDGKAAVMDEDFKCRTNAEFDGVMTRDVVWWYSHNPAWEEGIIIKGKSAVIAYQERMVEDDDGDRYKGNYCGIMSCTGETLIKPEYNKIEPYEDYGYNGLLKITTMEGKEGIYNSELEEVLPCKYNDIGYFRNEEGRFWFFGYDKDTGEAIVMDEDFKCYTNAEFNAIKTTNKGLSQDWQCQNWENIVIKGKPAVIAYLGIVEQDENGTRYERRYYGIMSRTGETLIKPQYKEIEPYEGYNGLLKITTMEGKVGIYNSELEEVLPCKYNYVDFDSEDDSLLYGYDNDTGEAVVVLDGKVIWREQIGKNLGRFPFSAYSGDRYIDKEWIYVSFYKNGKTYYKIITYEGISLTDYISDSEWPQKEEEISKKNKEESEQWLSEQSKKDAEKVKAFFKEKGVTLSNIETTCESYDLFVGWNWVKISAEYADNGSKNTNAANPGKLLYTLIYNKRGECVISGRSFCHEPIWGKYGGIVNDEECLTLLSNDGELCFLPQARQEAVTLCKIDEKDGLAYLRVKDQAGSDNSNMSDNGEPFQLYYEESDIPGFSRYVEARMVNGTLEEKSHEYWQNTRIVFSAESIIENFGEHYYLVENDDAKIDVYSLGFEKNNLVTHLKCSADEMRSKQLKAVELDFDAAIRGYDYGMCMFCNKHRRVTVIMNNHVRWQVTYEQLGISGSLSDSASVRVVSGGFLGKYVIGIDDIYICVDVDAELLYRVDKATVERMEEVKKIYNFGEYDKGIETADKIYVAAEKENFIRITSIDKNTCEMTEQDVPYTDGWIESLHVLKDRIFIQYRQEEGEKRNKYGLIDIQGQEQKLLGTGMIRFVGNYMIQDGILYDSSFCPLATNVEVSNFYIEDYDYDYIRYDLIFSTKGEDTGESEFKPIVLNKVTKNEVCTLPDNISLNVNPYWSMLLNGFVKLVFGVADKQRRTLLLDPSAADKVVFYGDGDAYIHQDEKEHRIIIFGENKGVLGQDGTDDKEDKDKAVGVNVAYHSQQEIRDYVKKNTASVKDALTFAENPVTDKPYSLGKLSDATLQSAAAMLNQVRYIAGISDEVQLSDSYSEQAQAAALSNYVNNELSHNPAQSDGMSDDMYALAKQGASSSNIAWGSRPNRSMNETIVSGWMEDGDSSNINRVGHRRWILNPKMGKTGFGAVSGKNGTYSAVYAFDNSNSTAQEYGVMWPAQNMPVEYFGEEYPWSISMGYAVDESKVQVTLTRKEDGKKWSFSKASADGDFYVNNDGYGQKGCIIFRPDKGIDKYEVGEEFQVEITGLEQGDVSYTVTFFTLAEDTAPTASPTPTSVPDSSGRPGVAVTPNPVVPLSPAPAATPTSTPMATVTPSPTVAATEMPKPSAIIPTPERTLDPDGTPDVMPTQTPDDITEPSATPEPITDPDEEPADSVKKLKKGAKVTDKKTKAVYKITGTGNKKMAEYVKSSKKAKSNVSVPATVKLQGKTFKVTSIAKNAFKKDKKLKSVSIGKNVKKVGSGAFNGCKSLEKVTVGKNVAAIEASAFRGCNSLTMVTIPSKVKKIGANAFRQCKNLRYIMVKTKKLTQANVGKNAFSGGYRSPRIKTDKSIWKPYSKIFLKRGISGKAVFIIDPVKLVI